MKPVFPLLLLLSFLLASATLLPPRHDFSGQYRPHQPVAETRREGDSLRLFVRFPAGALRVGQPLYVAGWADYDAKRPLWQDSVRHLRRQRRQLADGTSLVEFAVAASRVSPGLVLSVQPTAAPTEDASGEAWLEVTPQRLQRAYLLTDSVGDPLLRRYVRQGEAFGVDHYGAERPFRAKQYNMEFAAALPPMTNPATQPPRPRTLAVRDTLPFRAGQLVRLRQPGIYALQFGPDEPQTGLLVAENQYPALTTAAELIEPLIYLTSSDERKRLYAAPDPKRAVDQFWLGVAGQRQDIGRQLIRTYYGRVAGANDLFSAHKAGWMTDRGMLYVVLGPPDAVYRSGPEERWVYHAPAIASGTYVFRAKPSTFAPDNYELVRRPEYEALWYAAVEQWRKGLIARPAR